MRSSSRLFSSERRPKNKKETCKTSKHRSQFSLCYHEDHKKESTNTNVSSASCIQKKTEMIDQVCEQISPKVKIIKDNDSIPPSLLKIPITINKCISALHHSCLPNDKIIELSSHLKNIKNIVHQMEFGEITVNSIHVKCTEEWNLFGQQIDDLVLIDETTNIISFCNKQISSIISKVNIMHTNSDKMPKTSTASKQVHRIETKIDEINLLLTTKDTANLQEALKTFSHVVANSDKAFSLVDQSSNSAQNLFHNFLTQAINSMLQFIENSNEAVKSRKYLQVIAFETLKEIQVWFSEAEKEEKRINRKKMFKSEQYNIDMPQSSPKTNRKPKTNQFSSVPVPKHTPVSRPKLYEERRRVTAMGPLRARFAIPI